MRKLTTAEIFKLGHAYGAFSAREIDYGLHVVLPGKFESGETENEIFAFLFDNYFDLIPEDLEPDTMSIIYMGAVEAFAMDTQLGLALENNCVNVFKAMKESL